MIDASKSGWVIDVSEENFEHEVVERSKSVPVLLDFWAPWCGPCKTLGPVLEKIAAAKNGDFVLAKVNIDECQNLAGYFGIEGVPTIHAMKGGEFIPGFVGIPEEQQIKELFDQLLPSEAETAVKQAQALEATDPAQAENMYRIVLSKEPDREAARLGLARLLVAKKEWPEATQLLAPLGNIGEAGAEAERLRRIIEVQGGDGDGGGGGRGGDDKDLRAKLAADPENARLHYELGALLAQQAKYPEALESLLAAAERDKTLAKNEVKELMVKIFQIIGVRSELADDYRAKLQSLLY